MSPIFIGPQSSTGYPNIGYRMPLSGGEAGTAQTIKVMRQLVDQAVSDPTFIRKAVDIVRAVPAFDEIAELEALYAWVQRNIRYTKDPVTKEKLYPPQEMLKIRAGDCDDISMLLAAFSIALGYPSRFITVSANPEQPEEFSHVYVESEAPAGSGNWIPLDAARRGAQFGEAPPHFFRKRAWSVTDDTYKDLGKLSGYAGMDGMGDDLGDWSDINWGDIIQQSVQEVPAIISSARGGSSHVTNPYGSVATSGPYGSFATPYTPGYGIPSGGYGGTASASGGIAGISWPILALVGVGLLLLKGRK